MLEWIGGQMQTRIHSRCIRHAFWTRLAYVLNAYRSWQKWAWQLIKSCCSFITRFCTCTDVSGCVSCVSCQMQTLPFIWAVPYRNNYNGPTDVLFVLCFFVYCIHSLVQCHCNECRGTDWSSLVLLLSNVACYSHS